MNLFRILSDIEQVDPEIYDRLDSRRRVFQHLTTAGKTIGAAALPGFLSSVFNKAYGQGGGLPAPIADVLNFALKLEYLEATFYTQGLAAAGLNATLTGPARAGIELIRTDENNHVTVLRNVLGSQAIAAIPASAFDFTGSKGGSRAPLFPTVFTDVATFLTVGQALEDTGVRAYKGGAPALMPNKTILTAALNIHSVEARHASHLRTMRRGGAQSAQNQTMTPKSWISLNETVPAAAAAVYGAGNPPTPPSGATEANASRFFPAESNVRQAGVALPGATSQTDAAVAESFDEPLDMATVTTIALNFVVGNTL